jgi:hypothetical protein
LETKNRLDAVIIIYERIGKLYELIEWERENMASIARLSGIVDKTLFHTFNEKDYEISFNKDGEITRIK